MTTIQIQKVSPPTAKQRESNIFGSCNLLIISEEGTPMAYLNNITIRLNSKTNTKFLAPPSFKYDAKDGTTKHMNYYSLLPLGNDESQHEAQRESLRALTAEVIQYAENGGLNNTPRKPQQNTSTPVATPATTNPSDPWA